MNLGLEIFKARLYLLKYLHIFLSYPIVVFKLFITVQFVFFTFVYLLFLLLFIFLSLCFCLHIFYRTVVESPFMFLNVSLLFSLCFSLFYIYCFIYYFYFFKFMFLSVDQLYN